MPHPNAGSVTSLALVRGWKKALGKKSDGIKDPCSLCIQMKKSLTERENGKDKKSSIAIVKFISSPAMILNCSLS